MSVLFDLLREFRLVEGEVETAFSIFRTRLLKFEEEYYLWRWVFAFVVAFMAWASYLGYPRLISPNLVLAISSFLLSTLMGPDARNNYQHSDALVR